MPWLACDGQGRRVLPLQTLPRVIEHRLHRLTDLDQVLEGCETARNLGLAAVTCRPEHVRAVASELMGSGIEITSAVEFDDPPGRPAEREQVLEEARRLASAGATDVAVVADRFRLSGSEPLAAFEAVVSELVAVMTPRGVRVRVHLDVTSVDEDVVARAARALEGAGVWMVQVGTWRQDCTSFGAVQAARRVLAEQTLVKWTTPARSVSSLLFAMGEGVDRFNAADVGQLIGAARRSSVAGPLLLPCAGLDY